MKDDLFKKWNLMTNEMQKSLQSMVELNAKTLQSFSYLKSGDLSGLKQPGDILGKHIALTMENSQKLLDYMHKSFQILESALLSVSKEVKDDSGELFTQARTEFAPEGKKTRKPRAKAAPKEKKAQSVASSKKEAKAEIKKEDKPKRKTKVSGSAAKANKVKAKSQVKSRPLTGTLASEEHSDIRVEKLKQAVAGTTMSEQENKLKNPLQK